MKRRQRAFKITGLTLTEVEQFAALQREVKRVVSMTWWGVGRDFC
jgi:hypothetical protein